MEEYQVEDCASLTKKNEERSGNEQNYNMNIYFSVYLMQKDFSLTWGFLVIGALYFLPRIESYVRARANGSVYFSLNVFLDSLFPLPGGFIYFSWKFASSL